jgi:hypothetical protein
MWTLVVTLRLLGSAHLQVLAQPGYANEAACVAVALHPAVPAGYEVVNTTCMPWSEV